MSRKLRWAATTVPQMRRGLIGASAAEADRLTLVSESAARMGRHGPAAELLDTARQHQMLAERLRLADLFWVTDPMARVAMDAALDVPHLSADMMPSANGLMAFERPLPPFSTAGIGGLDLRDEATGRIAVPHPDPVPVSALVWMRERDLLHVHLLCRPDALPLPLTPHDSELLVAFMRVTSPLPVTLAEVPDHQQHVAALMSLLASAWHLMQIPTLAERKSLDGEWGGPATASTKPDRLVTTIDLRPLRHVTPTDPAPDDPDRRRLTVRHYVRGHWRQQPVGPNRSERRLTYVEPYIKGPPGAPLKHTEKVMVWRR